MSEETPATGSVISPVQTPMQIPIQYPSDDPYYVTNSEITGNSIVSEVLIGRENYVGWKKAMEIALSARLKLGFVRGDCPRPTDPVMMARWQRCNDAIMTWLLASVSKSVISLILHADDVVCAWKSLQMKYAGTNVSRKFALQQEIAALVQGELSIAKYFEKLTGLWQEVNSMRKRRTCSINDNCSNCQDTAQEMEEAKVIKFLMGVNDSHSHIRTHILALRELPSLDEVYDLLTNDESQQKLTRPISIDASAMYARYQQPSSGQYQQSGSNYSGQFQQLTPGSTGRPVQYQKNNQSIINKMKQRPYCTHCQQNGHTRETCYKLNGYPQGHKLYRGKSNPEKGTANNAIRLPGDVNVRNLADQGSNKSTQSGAQLTTEQVNQLLALLKQGTTEAGENQCNMAGLCQEDYPKDW